MKGEGKTGKGPSYPDHGDHVLQRGPANGRGDGSDQCGLTFAQTIQGRSEGVEEGAGVPLTEGIGPRRDDDDTRVRESMQRQWHLDAPPWFREGERGAGARVRVSAASGCSRDPLGLTGGAAAGVRLPWRAHATALPYG
jgi:hypothetical protein